MFYVRGAICALALLGAVVGAAQTVIRIAPPPPVRVGVVGVAPGPGYVLDSGIPKLEWSRIRLGGREVGSSPTGRCHLGATSLCPLRKHMGVSQRILALAKVKARRPTTLAMVGSGIWSRSSI